MHLIELLENLDKERRSYAAGSTKDHILAEAYRVKIGQLAEQKHPTEFDHKACERVRDEIKLAAGREKQAIAEAKYMAILNEKTERMSRETAALKRETATLEREANRLREDASQRRAGLSRLERGTAELAQIAKTSD